MTFEFLGLNQTLCTALQSHNITAPTAVQQQGLVPILQGKDTIIQWQTGSGKTLTYLLPLYQNQGEVVEKGAQAIILVPTRELAMQVHHEVAMLSEASGIPLKSAVLFGNVNINTQIERLKEKPQIIIGTCERVLALIQKKKISAHTVKCFIVDEADKLVNKQAIASLRAVRKTCMKFTQSVFVSATYTPEDMARIREMTTDPAIILSEQRDEIPDTITHQFLQCDTRDKLEYLRKLLRILKPERSIIFVNNLEQINLAVEKLKYHGFDCACIHSDSSKQERQAHLTAFKTGKLQHLVTTDLGARGLHVDDVPYIFHIDISEQPTDYLHRAGRTGRTGNLGHSVCLIAPFELELLKKYRAKFGIVWEEIATRENTIFPVEPTT